MKGLILIGVLAICGSVIAGGYGGYNSYQINKNYGGGGGQSSLDINASGVGEEKHAAGVTGAVATSHINPNHVEKQGISGVAGFVDVTIIPRPIQTGVSFDDASNIHGKESHSITGTADLAGHNNHKTVNHEEGFLINSGNGIKEAHSFHGGNANGGLHGQNEHNGEGLVGSNHNLGGQHNIQTGASFDTTGGIIGKEIHSLHGDIHSAAVHVVHDQLKAVDGIIDDLNKNLNIAIEKRKEIESFFGNIHQGQKVIGGDVLTSHGFGTGVQGHHEDGQTLDINGGIHSNTNIGASNVALENHHTVHGAVALGAGGLVNDKKMADINNEHQIKEELEQKNNGLAATGGTYDGSGSGSGGLTFGNGQPLNTAGIHLGGPVHEKDTHINFNVEKHILDERQKHMGNIGITGTLNGGIENHHVSEFGTGAAGGLGLQDTVALNPNQHNVGVETSVIAGGSTLNSGVINSGVPLPLPDDTHQSGNKITLNVDKSCALGSLNCGLEHIGNPSDKDLNSGHAVDSTLNQNYQPHNHEDVKPINGGINQAHSVEAMLHQNHHSHNQGDEKPYIDTTINGGIKPAHNVDLTLHNSQQTYNHGDEKPYIDTTINGGIRPVHPIDPMLHQNQPHNHGHEKPFIDTTINAGTRPVHSMDPLLHQNQPHNHGDEKPYIDSTINGGINTAHPIDPLLHHNLPGHSNNEGHMTLGVSGVLPVGVGPYGGGITGAGGYGSTGGKGNGGSYGGSHGESLGGSHGGLHGGSHGGSHGGLHGGSHGGSLGGSHGGSHGAYGGSHGGIGIGTGLGGYGNNNYPPPYPYGGSGGGGYGSGYSQGHGAHGYGAQGYGAHQGLHHGPHNGAHHGPHGYGQIHNNYDGPVGGPNGYGPNDNSYGRNNGFLGRGPFGGGISVGGYY